MNFYRRLIELVLSGVLLAGFALPSALADPKPLPKLPSSMPLQDYEVKVIYPWATNRDYAGLTGWKVDSKVRDTGPFIESQYFGTHPAVRIHYSPEAVKWIEGGRKGDVPQGAILIKEMFNPPAALYQTLAENPYFKKHPKIYEAMLADLIVGWTIMIQDKGGKSKDGWFWTGPFKGAPFDGPGFNVDDYSHELASGFGVGTCIRCHASADNGNTFASATNYDPDAIPLQFRSDNSWRSKDHLTNNATVGKPDGTHESVWSIISRYMEKAPAADRKALFATLNLPAQQRPYYTAPKSQNDSTKSEHNPTQLTSARTADDKPLPKPNQAFLHAFRDLHHMNPDPSKKEQKRFSLPSAYSDNVYPSSDPQHYLTSSNCLGCHGGLGGAPSGVSMFVATGSGYGEGYNVSPFGEWRWSPMGLAGRDPIFHAQLESEMIILLQENGALKNGKPGPAKVQKVQQALADTCLRCHGAMGLRQKGLNQSGSILDPQFNPEIFYLTEPLTAEQETDPPFVPYPNQPIPPTPYHKIEDAPYGELAREGISCAVCHHIAPPAENTVADWIRGIEQDDPKWLAPYDDSLWTQPFLYVLAKNNTGLYERSEADELLGPVADVREKPMQHAMNIKPVVSPPLVEGRVPFTQDSGMCGTCHTINLPNIGATENPFPVLTDLEPNEHFKGIPHSVEQATYLEWLNSKFGPGKKNRKGPDFQSCQDCHMPNRFVAPDGDDPAQPIEPLVSQIATIQDSTYPASDHQLPSGEIDVPLRADYNRHELVGLNGFMVAMVKQFPEVLGVEDSDYETSATTGAELAIGNMALSIKEGRVGSVAIRKVARNDATGKLEVDVEVANTTGHRLPSGVAFRRAWLALEVRDADGKLLWASGRPNAGGLITDTKGQVLGTELLRGGSYQPHREFITDDTQVQIYEELVQNAEGQFTTSFVHRVKHIKDNRLLPAGWVTASDFAGKSSDSDIPDQGDLLYQFMQSTEPDGVGKDPDFAASPNSGKDRVAYRIPEAALDGTPAEVTARFYYQSFQPSWFYQRFELANRAKQAGYNTPETDRLFYLAAHLNLEGTMMEGWKIEIDSDSESVPN